MQRSQDPGRANSVTPVAEYVRMSTDLQVYSPTNQSMAIAAYAEEHGMRVVRSYLDEGRSGLDFGGRDALRRLIADVQAGHAEFDAVLVFDVSRWGRFQNSDEAAYYEFLCTQAGVKVYYVAEPFDNDGSPLATILKGLKRTMAAEYSRELSAKVFAGQCRLSRMGFRQGGSSGYGMRRMLIDAAGNHKGLLAPGQRKSISTDRVTLVPGPPNELATLRRIFRAYVAGATTRQIADRLNVEGVPNFFKRPWGRGAIRRILMDEKYIGNNVFARHSKKLRQPTTPNPPSTWARKDAAFKAIISPDLFRRAGELLTRRYAIDTDDELLDGIRRIIARDGCVNIHSINADPSVAHSTTYIRRFGSMRKIYERVGYQWTGHIDSFVDKQRIRVWHTSVLAFIAELLADAGSRIERERDLIVVDDAWTIGVVVLRALRYRGKYRWRVHAVPGGADVVVMPRMPPDGSAPADHIILPRLAYPSYPPALYESNVPSIEARTYPSLAILRDLAVISRPGPRLCG